MVKYCFLILTLLFFPISIFSQEDTLNLNLEAVIKMAINNASDIQLAHSYLREIEYARAQFYQDLKPTLKLNTITPNLSRSIEARPLPDGRDAFVNRATMYNSIALELNHQLPFINGSWYASTKLERLDVFRTTQFPSSQTYFFTPISVGINLPLFTFNGLRWEEERLELQNRKLTAQQADIQEEVIGEAIVLFSNCFQLQKQLEILIQQIKDTDSLIHIKKRLNEIGRASKTEILQLELLRQNNKNEYSQNIADFNNAEKELFEFIKLNNSDLAIQYIYPDNWEPVNINEDLALTQINQNEYIRAKHLLEKRTVESELEEVKKNNGLRLTLNASVGLNKTDESVTDVYKNLLDREVISARLEVPILGKRSQRLNEKRLEEIIYQQDIKRADELMGMQRLLIGLIAEYNLLKQRIATNQEAMDISNEIYELTRLQFLAGNVSYNDLNIVNREKNQAAYDYFNIVFSTIIKYYEIRRVCLYDFVKNKNLVSN